MHRYSRRLWAALLAEFLGLAIFQVYGGSANDDVAALANGITLAVIGTISPLASWQCCILLHFPKRAQDVMRKLWGVWGSHSLAGPKSAGQADAQAMMLWM